MTSFIELLGEYALYNTKGESPANPSTSRAPRGGGEGRERRSGACFRILRERACWRTRGRKALTKLDGAVWLNRGGLRGLPVARLQIRDGMLGPSRVARMAGCLARPQPAGERVGLDGEAPSQGRKEVGPLPRLQAPCRGYLEALHKWSQAGSWDAVSDGALHSLVRCQHRQVTVRGARALTCAQSLQPC